MQLFNVMQCINLLSLCCQGKSDLAEIKCQNEIMNMLTVLQLYKVTGKFWPFKTALLLYVAHCYLDAA